MLRNLQCRLPGATVRVSDSESPMYPGNRSCKRWSVPKACFPFSFGLEARCGLFLDSPTANLLKRVGFALTHFGEEG